MRLRNLTGNQELKTQAMIDSAHLSAGDLASEYLWRPFVLFFEPILLVYNTYLALIYGTSRSTFFFSTLVREELGLDWTDG